MQKVTRTTSFLNIVAFLASSLSSSRLIAIGLFVLLPISCGRAPGHDRDGGANGRPDAVTVTGTPQWAMFGANAKRNGLARFSISVDGIVQAYQLEEPDGAFRGLSVEAVGPEGTVYAMARWNSQLGRLHAINPTGDQSWVYPHDHGCLVGGPALHQDGFLFFEGYVTEPQPSPLDTKTSLVFKLSSSGHLAWSWNPPYLSHPLIDARLSSALYDNDGSFYILLPDGSEQPATDEQYYLYSFSSQGELRWRWHKRLGSHPYPPIASPSGAIFVSSETGLHKLNSFGEEQWLFASSAITSMAVSGDGNIVLAASSNVNSIMSVSDSGSLQWNQTLGSELLSNTTSLGIGPENTIYSGYAPNAPPFFDGVLLAVSSDGSTMLEHDLRGIPCGGLAIDLEGRVFLTTLFPDERRILGKDKDGQEILNVVVDSQPEMSCLHSTLDFIASSVVAAGGVLLTGSSNGSLVAVH